MNTPSDEGTEGVRRAYPPDKLARLTALKDAYDPRQRSSTSTTTSGRLLPPNRLAEPSAGEVRPHVRGSIYPTADPKLNGITPSPVEVGP